MTTTAYVWIKAVHVSSVMVFAGVVLSQALFLAAAPGDGSASARRFQRAEAVLTLPAIVLALSSGVVVAVAGRWFPVGWLLLKLLLVFALLAVHGLQSGQLRRIAAGSAHASVRLYYVVPCVVVAISVLAVVKP